jgi:hypothetical protein
MPKPMPMAILSALERLVSVLDVGSILDRLLVVIPDIEKEFVVLIFYNETEFILEAVLGTSNVDKELTGPAEFVGDDIAILVGMALF